MRATNDRDVIPFEDGSFDLILNRHGAFNAEEVARTLRPGGAFLPQQVDGQNLSDLAAAFDVSYESEHTLQNTIKRFRTLGFKITQSDETSCTNEFSDVGAIVYLLTAIPWIVPGFSVDSHVEYLQALQSRFEETGSLRFQSRYFLLTALKPA